MKKRFSKLLLAVAMTLQLTPSSLGTIIANDSVAYSSEYIQIGMENQPAGTFEAASSDIPEGVEKLNVTVNVDGTVKDTKLLTFTSGTDPAKTEIAANDGYAIESVTLDGEAFNGSIGYNREVGENEKNLIVNVYTKASLTIHYQDANGHAIAADDVKEGKLNGEVPIEAKAIEGYTAVGEKVKDFTITVKYEKSVSPAPKARMTTTNAKAGECSVSITKNCYKADGTYVDEKGVEYPVYLNADTLGPSGHKPHTVAFVPGQSSNNCQQNMYIGTYGPRNIHYVVIKYSPSSNEITYIRCDKYDGEEEDKNYYKVTYTDEYDKFLGEEAVLENTKPMKVPDMQESGYWTLQGETKQVDPKEYTVNGTTVFVYKYNPVTEIKATYHSTSNDDNFPKYFKYGIDQNIVVEKVDPLPNDHDQSGKHIFVGWVTSIDGYKGTQVISNSNQWNKIKSKIKYPGDTLGILKDDVHLYAVFADRSAIKDEKVTIRYAVNPDNSGKLSKTYETINEYTGTPEGSTAAANTGYEFVNWTDAEGNEVGTNAKFIPQKVDGIRYSNSVYYANFEKKESTVIIKYKSNDVNMGTVNPTYERLGEETGIAIGSAATAKKGYAFKNWTDQNGKIVSWEKEFKPAKVEGKNVAGTYTANFGKDDNGDNIPDDYQIKVTYSAVNGTIDSAHAGKIHYVTLYKDGKMATAADGGVGSLTADQIATATAADGYRQNSLKWTPKTPTTSLELNSDTEFKATFSKDYFKYRVEYYYDGELGTTDYKGAVEFEKEVSVTPKKSVEYENKTYALDKTVNTPLKITSNEKNNVIKVYYGLDENKDVVPDIYQAKVTYSAVNGTIDSAHAGKTYHVTLFKDGKWATAKDGGIGTLTADQIATATAANGYAQNSLNWTPDVPTTLLKLNSDTEFKATFSKDYFKYRVEYYYDGELGTTDYKGAVEFEKEVSVTPKKSVEYENKTYALDKTVNTPLKITSNEKNNVIKVYYGLDENKDVVPDIYQAKVTYSAVNGTIDSAHAGKTYHVTLFKDGKWATAKDGGIGTLTADQIATATAANGYAQNSLNWTPDVPTTLLKLNSDTEFKATFSKDYFKYRVEYYYDGNLGTTDNKDAVEFEKEVSVTPKKSVEYENKTYALDKTENNPLKITSNVEKNVIRVYYGLDENKDVVPDDYQAIVTYKAVNGIVGFDKVYVTLFNNEGEWAKDGVGQLTKEQIPTTTPNKGYHFVNWTPATPVEGTKITRNGTTTFTANHAINTYSATVNYIDEDSGKEIAPATPVADIEHDKELDGNTYAKAIDGYAFTQAEKVTITQDNMAVNVYYSVDVVGTDPNNPDQPDGIPDKYQAEVTFAAVNGAVSFNRTYVTLYMDNVYSVKGIGFLSNQQIPTTTPNEGYHFVNWSPMEPAIDRSITKQGAAFTANHAINTYSATVRFIDEDNGTEIAPAETINGIEHGFILNGAAHRIAITGYAFTTADTAIIERDHAIVNVYYSVDTKGGEGNPDNTSDGIPDKYQVRFAYTAAENGSVNGTVIEYVTRPGHVTTAPVRPQALVDALADDGYSFVNWTADGNVYLNTDAIRNTYFTGDTVFTAGFAAVPVPVVPIPVVPTPPAVSPTVTPPAPVLPVAPLVTPPAVVPVVPAPAPAPAPGPTVEENEPERPKVEETEEVDENVTAKAGSEGSWALINLLCSGGTVLLGLILLLSKLKKEEDEEEDKTAAMRNGNNKQSERYKRRKWLRAVSTVTAVVSVIVFFLTEDMSLAMVLIDKWTLLMAAFLIIQIIFVLFGRKWKELDEKAENTEAAHS